MAGSLRTVMRNFTHGDKKYYKNGDWEVATGGYDLWFQVSYRGTPVINCVAGKLEIIDGSFPKLLKNLEIVSEEYGNLSYGKYARLAFAEDGNDEVLNKLVYDEDADVRLAVANRCRPQDLEILRNDEIGIVRETADRLYQKIKAIEKSIHKNDIAKG